MESLVRLVVRIAEQAGVSEVSGLPVLDWFNAPRHVQVERFIRSIRREFPAYADDVTIFIMIVLGMPARQPRVMNVTLVQWKENGDFNPAASKKRSHGIPSGSTLFPVRRVEFHSCPLLRRLLSIGSRAGGRSMLSARF